MIMQNTFRAVRKSTVSAAAILAFAGATFSAPSFAVEPIGADRILDNPAVASMGLLLPAVQKFVDAVESTATQAILLPAVQKLTARTGITTAQATLSGRKMGGDY